MRKILLIIVVFAVQLQAQIIHPDELRRAIYESIQTDIQQKNPQNLNKQIYLDNTIGKVEYVDLLNVDLVLSEPKYQNDKNFCQQMFNVNCVDKYQIDHYKLAKIYNEHKDTDYPDFYGIYAPIDHWYQLVYQILNNNLKKEDKVKAEIVIPVKNTYFKDGVICTNLYFYKYIINENFEIIKKENIKL